MKTTEKGISKKGVVIYLFVLLGIAIAAYVHIYTNDHRIGFSKQEVEEFMNDQRSKESPDKVEKWMQLGKSDTWVAYVQWKHEDPSTEEIVVAYRLATFKLGWNGKLSCQKSCMQPNFPENLHSIEDELVETDKGEYLVLYGENNASTYHRLTYLIGDDYLLFDEQVEGESWITMAKKMPTHQQRVYGDIVLYDRQGQEIER